MAILFRMALLIAGMFAGFGVSAETAYAPPEIVQGENGWEDYVDPPMIDKGSAQGLEPGLDTPEGAVVRYLASRVRDDRGWKDAMSSDLDRKAKKSLGNWDDWTLHSAQLKSRKLKSDRGYLRVWMEFTISGERDDGTDDFTVVREGDGWRVASPPS